MKSDILHFDYMHIIIRNIRRISGPIKGTNTFFDLSRQEVSREKNHRRDSNAKANDRRSRTCQFTYSTWRIPFVHSLLIFDKKAVFTDITIQFE
jgi:hypothetical protein